jgi:Right handed beta helix region
MGGHSGPGWSQSRRGARRRWRTVAALLAVAAVAAAVTWAVMPPRATADPPPASVRVTCQNRDTDAATLQRAIDNSPAGAAIEFQGGTCLLTKGLVLLGDRTYTGESTTGTILKQAGPAGYVLAARSYVASASATGDPLTIRDLTVACDGSGRTDGIIVLNWQADVEHVDVSHCGGSGIVDTSAGASGRVITNTSVNSRFDSNFISGSGQFGFEVIDPGNAVTDGYLDNNQIEGSGLDAVYLGNAGGWDISGNHLYNVAHSAIVALRLYGTTISGNYVEDFGAGQRSGTWYGIVGTAQDGNGSAIAGNKIFNDRGERAGSHYLYLAVTKANSGTGHVAVTGNVIMGSRAGDVGLSFAGAPARLAATASGNEITGVGRARAVLPGASVTVGS